MAHAIVTQIIEKGPKFEVVKITIKGDGASGELSGDLLYTGTSLSSINYVGSHLNDVTLSGTFTGSAFTQYRFRIDGEGTPDTFQWSNNDGATWAATGVAITGGPQLLENDIYITFAATTGHTKDYSEYWYFTGTGGLTNKIVDISYCLNGFTAELYWDANTDVLIMSLANGKPYHENFLKYGCLRNAGGTGVTGNIVITSAGLAAQTYDGHIILRMAKRD